VLVSLAGVMDDCCWVFFGVVLYFFILMCVAMFLVCVLVVFFYFCFFLFVFVVLFGVERDGWRPANPGAAQLSFAAISRNADRLA